MPTLFMLPESMQYRIMSEAKQYSYGDIAKILAIVTQEPSLPGHSDQGHNTQIIPISTRLVEPAKVDQASDTAIQLNVIACLTCLTESRTLHDQNNSPYTLFATSQKIKNLA